MPALFLQKSKDNATYILKDTTKTPFFHHVALLKELKKASDTGILYTYHFNILRNILEKTASFHGYAHFSSCIRKGDEENEPVYTRVVNLLSHGNYSLFEPKEMVDENTKFFINPTGRFVIGGPHGDSGLTGRKIIVDTYGGAGRHGGGAFSGKDCTKVDRSAAYAARYVAKNIVAAGLADKCEIQLSYAIGVAHPTSVHVDTFGTGKLSDTKLVEIIRENFDLRPAGIIKMLDLRRPIYKQTAAYGHFGRTDVDLPWEHLDKVEDLKKYLA